MAKTARKNRKGNSPKVKKAKAETDIYKLMVSEKEKIKPSVYGVKVTALTKEFTDALEKEKVPAEKVSLKKAIKGLTEVQNVFSKSESKVYGGRTFDKIVKGFPNWVTKNPHNDKIIELGKFIAAGQDYLLANKKVNKKGAVSFNVDKDLPKVEAVVNAIKSKKVTPETGLGKNEIVAKCGGPSKDLSAGKTSTCVTALINGIKSGNEEVASKVKKEGTKYFFL